MEIINTVASFFQTGGLFMWPILIVLAAGLAVAVERYIFLSLTHRGTRRLWNELAPMLRAGDFERLSEIVAESRQLLSGVINHAMLRLPSAEHREDIEAAMEEGLMEAIPRIERRTHYLATFANIATLLGLLGTIVGLIDAFQAVANADPAEKANMLSDSISIAMNTTAFGLIAAIPLLLIHSFLQSKTSTIIDSLEMASVKSLNLITREPVDA